MRWRSELLLALFVLAPGVATATQDLQTLQALEVREMQFISGGAVLSPQERQTCAELVVEALHAEPARVYKGDAEAAANLAKAAHDPAYAAELREVWRQGYLFPKDVPNDMRPILQQEQAMLQEHDPVVAIDPAHRRAVTQASLAALHSAADAIATNANVSRPDAGFESRARHLVQADFTAMDPAEAEGLAHIGRNGAYLQMFFAHANPQKKAALLAQVHASVAGAKDADDQTRRLVQTTAIMAASAEKLTLQGLMDQYAMRRMSGTHQIMQGMINRQLQQNVWSIGHPGCAPGGGNPSACSQAPIFRSVPMTP